MTAEMSRMNCPDNGRLTLFPGCGKKNKFIQESQHGRFEKSAQLHFSILVDQKDV